MMIALAACLPAYLFAPPAHRQSAASRPVGASPRAVIAASVVAPKTSPEKGNKKQEFTPWQATESGIKFVDEVVGAGEAPGPDAVVSLHYSVFLGRSGMTLGTSRGRWPLTFAQGKHPVPIFGEAVQGMRVGGKRRLSVLPSQIPETQMQNVPQDQFDEGLRFEIELVGVETGLRAVIPSLLPPGNRRVQLARLVFFLSFLPYFLPEHLKPGLWQAGDVEAIAAARMHSQQVSQVLGGAAIDLDALGL